MNRNPHDRFARWLFADPDIMRIQLRALLPAGILARLNLDTLNREPDTLLDPQLDERVPDLVFSVALRGGGRAILRLLFEHKSWSDRGLTFQLLGGTIRIIDSWRREHPKSPEYPWVIPIVLYSGTRRFTAPKRFAELCRAAAPGDGSTAVPGADLRFLLADLSRWSDEEIRARAGAAAQAALGMLLLKHLGRPELENKLRTWADLFVDVYRLPQPIGALRAVLSYLWESRAGVSQEAVIQILLPRLQTEERRTAMNRVQSYADQLRSEGRERGIEQGLEQGLEQGRRQVAHDKLVRLLASRFELSQNVEARLCDSTMEQLDRWFDRALEASSLDAVFTPDSPFDGDEGAP